MSEPATKEDVAALAQEIREVRAILARAEKAILPVLANPGAIMARMLKPKG